ncbi:MAG TPA: Pr6Pr family membrane protein [Actinomycetaceae bacterium]|nr:Pr6Pr family membrane protein [Actinomycetaceae bacterium]
MRVLAALPGAAGLLGLYLEFYTERGVRGFVEYASYFTNISNAGYIAVTLGLAFLPVRVTSSNGFVAVRGSVTIAMILTGLGYAALLGDTAGLFRHPWINHTIHGIMPLIALLDWMLFPPGAPRLRFSTSAWQWLVYPAAWAGYTFVHGAFMGWYPYPFVDPNVVGTWGVVGAMAGMLLVLLLLTFLAVAYQRRRVGTTSASEASDSVGGTRRLVR